ncbi:unnamed protein product [Amoebophrya sp. A25]|nr:unnamed protein product [Amoebophrya sp. A25]|eukprot:GSA25T00007473001.1
MKMLSSLARVGRWSLPHPRREKRAFSAALRPYAPRPSRRAHFLSYEASQTYMKRFGLKSSSDWIRWCRDGHRPPCIPSRPHAVYAHAGWSGFSDRLGCETELRESAVGKLRRVLYTHRRVVDAVLAHLETSSVKFDFLALPLRCSATLMFRVQGAADTRWCPLAVRGVREASLNRRKFPCHPARERTGLGLVYANMRDGEFFFFPHELLEEGARRKELRHLSRTSPLYVAREEARKHRVGDADGLARCLLEHLAASELYDEKGLYTRFSTRATDVVCHLLTTKLRAFLVNDCALSVSSREHAYVNAQFTLENFLCMARVCMNRRRNRLARRVDLYFRPRHSRMLPVASSSPSSTTTAFKNDGENESVGQHAPVPSLEKPKPDFVCALVRAESSPVDSGQTPNIRELVGAYMLPYSYLQAIGGGALPWEIYVYPPGSGARKACARHRQRVEFENGNFFLDLSCPESRKASIVKLRNILVNFSPSSTCSSFKNVTIQADQYSSDERAR